MMNDRSTAIAVLCSHLCAGEGVSPLEPKEYSSFAALLRSRQLDPEAILRFGKQDFMQALDMTEEQAERFSGCSTEAPVSASSSANMRAWASRC